MSFNDFTFYSEFIHDGGGSHSSGGSSGGGWDREATFGCLIILLGILAIAGFAMLVE